jgi:hypothetical protein
MDFNRVSRQDHVLRLDVAVDDAHGVRRRQAVGDGFRHLKSRN